MGSHSPGVRCRVQLRVRLEPCAAVQISRVRSSPLQHRQRFLLHKLEGYKVFTWPLALSRQQNIVAVLPRRLSTVVKSSGENADVEVGIETNSRFQQNFWGTVDVCGWIGSVAGAAAFVLTQELWLAALPVALPLVALIASRQKEKLAAKEARATSLRQYQALLTEQYGQSSQQVTEAMEKLQAELRAELSQQRSALSQPASQLKAIEAKLAALEGSVLSAGRVARDAARDVAASSSQLSRANSQSFDALRSALLRDLRAELSSMASDASPVVERLDSRIAALEKMLSGLEYSQSEAMRRLSNNLSMCITDAETSLETVIKSETFRALEPIRKLPQLLAASRPPSPELGMLPNGAQQTAVPQLIINEERVVALLSAEVRSALSSVIDTTLSDSLAEAESRSASLSPEQWSALGKRLSGVEAALQGLATSQASIEGALSTASLSAQLSDLKAQVAVAVQTMKAEDQGSWREAVQQTMQPYLDTVSSIHDTVKELGQTLSSMRSSVSTAQDVSSTVQQLGDIVKGLSMQVSSSGDGGSSDAQTAESISVLREAVDRLTEQFSSFAPASSSSVASDLTTLEDRVEKLATAVTTLSEELGGMMEGMQQWQATQSTQPASASTYGGPPTAPGVGGRAPSRDAPPPIMTRDNTTRDDAYDRLQALLASKRSSDDNGATSGRDTSFVSDDLIPDRSGRAQDTYGSASSSSDSDASAVSFSSWIGRGGRRDVESRPVLSDQMAFFAGLAAAPDKVYVTPTQDTPATPPSTSTVPPLFSQSAASAPSANNPSRDAPQQPTPYQIAPPARQPPMEPPPRNWQQQPPDTPDLFTRQTPPPSSSRQGDQQFEQQQGGGVRGPPTSRSSAQEGSAAGPGYGPPGYSDGTAPTPRGGGYQEPSSTSPGYGAGYDDGAGAASQSAGLGYGTGYDGGTSVPSRSGYPDPSTNSGAGYGGGYNDGAVVPARGTYEEASTAGSGYAAGYGVGRAGGVDEGGVSVEQEVGRLISSGLDFLRAGRAEYREAGGDLGIADSNLRQAENLFDQAASLDPTNIKALGNWGNALLAHGEVKKAMLSITLMSSPYSGASTRYDASIESAANQLRAEAQVLLVTAGKRFRGVMELQKDDVRALTNWGRALCLRAEITEDAQEAQVLLEAALQKFDAALDISPSFLPAVRACAMALRDLAMCQDIGSTAAEQLLGDAVDFLRQSLGVYPEEQGMEMWLRECEEELAKYAPL